MMSMSSHALSSREPAHLSAEQMAEEFSKLGPTAKARFLCRLGTRLTIFSRELYADRNPVPDAEQKMRGFNEIFHKVFGQLGHIVARSPQGYPDEAFVASLAALAEETLLMDQFISAWTFARLLPSRVQKASSRGG
ncbi:MAG TPA: hypothetical protein VMB73_03690 [Acetobacteraceae bacterium]|jgi:hypothetical protein|nr:hypothetical protein [Acetobacteraceae bacterium]